MQNIKINQESINNIYKNASMALQSLSVIINDIEDVALKQEVALEYEGYEKFIAELSTYMLTNNFEIKQINAVTKTMLKASTKVNTITDNSKNHIADMLIKGTMMGVVGLYEIINENNEEIASEIRGYARQLKDLEEKNVENLKKFL